MDVILIPLLTVLSAVIGIYSWIVIASVVVSWLVNFNVINSNNNFVITIIEFLYRVTEPVLSKIRRFLPIMGGFDLSPLVLILFLWFLQAVIGRLILRIMVGSV
jgi:YggT family protein